MSITAVILAAGAPTRSGTPKALVEVDGITHLARITATARSAGVSSVAVVAGPPDGDKIKTKLPVGAGVSWNPDPSRGMLSSIQAGISNLPHGTIAALIWPVDHAHVKADTVRTVMQGAPGKIVVPRHGGKGGHPVRVPRQLFGAILAQPSDATLAQFIHANPAAVLYVDVEDEAAVNDPDAAPEPRPEPKPEPKSKK